MSSASSGRFDQASQSVFTFRQMRLTASLPIVPLNNAASARRTRWVLVPVGAGDQRFHMLRHPGVARQHPALPFGGSSGYLAMGGQIVDATVVEARRPRLTGAEKATIKGGGTPEHWSKAKRAQMDRDGRWTLKRGRKKPAPDGLARTTTEIVVPTFGYKKHIGIDRRFGLIPPLPSPVPPPTTAASSKACLIPAIWRAASGLIPPLRCQPRPARPPRPRPAFPARQAERSANAGEHCPR
jgi:hypothetical protein